MGIEPVIGRVVSRAIQQRESGRLRPHWGDALLVDALCRVGIAFEDDQPIEIACDWLQDLIGPPIDLALPSWEWGYLPVAALTVNSAVRRRRYEEAAYQVADHMLRGAPRAAGGGMATHPGRPQLWVDTMFFSIPALLAVYQHSGRREYATEALSELDTHVARLRDPKTGLFYHCWDQGFDGQARFSEGHFEALADPPFWGRGNAWALLSLVAGADGLPEEDREAVAKQAAAMARVIAGHQDEKGLWHTVVDRPDTYPETSCSAMFALGLLRGKAGGLWGSAYDAAIDKAWRAISQRIDEEGNVNGVSAQTPPGRTKDYQAIPTGEETFGTAFVILLGLEINS